MTDHARELIAAARALADTVDRLEFAPPVSHVYNPLDYARSIHEAYLGRYADGRRRIVFLGMNPGPFGMTQTGVPFGEVAMVRDWLGLSGVIEKPATENPKRPIEGFSCTRSEVSGRRLWGLFRERFGTPGAFFTDHFVANYCPLVFLDGGRNLTPDKLPTAESRPLLEACDTHLRQLCDILQPEWVIGVGVWAEQRAAQALAGKKIRIGRVLHPSPASPAANRGWAEAATAQLEALDVW
jgi:single-strand selective monofunctional uracil DNA glycosylase